MNGTMAVMGRKGDVKTTWDSANADEVAVAQATFNELVIGKKYLAFKVQPDGKPGEQITAFDPEAESIIIVAPMQGGSR